MKETMTTMMMTRTMTTMHKDGDDDDDDDDDDGRRKTMMMKWSEGIQHKESKEVADGKISFFTKRVFLTTRHGRCF